MCVFNVVLEFKEEGILQGFFQGIFGLKSIIEKF